MYWYAQKVKKDKTKSYVYVDEEEIHKRFLGEYDANTMSGNPDATLGSTNIAKLFVLLLFKKL